MEFPFKNTGEKDVEIQSVRASCKCVTPTIGNQRVAPGEKGVVQAVMTIGNRTGLQRKMISVTTDQEGAARTVLMLEVSLPQAVSFDPAIVEWKEGDMPSEQVVTVSVKDDVDLEIVPVDGFSVELSGEQSKQIRIKPKRTDQAVSRLVRVNYSGASQGLASLVVRAR